jgi:hypothetical protein
VEDHASAVDIGDLQASQFGAPCPGAIERHQYNAMKLRLRRADEAGNFFRAQYAGQMSRLLGIRCISYAPSFLKRLNEEEPECGQPLRNGTCGKLPLAE